MHSLVHGNVKASNVLLRPDADAAALSDFSLRQLFAPSSTRAGGYPPRRWWTRGG